MADNAKTLIQLKNESGQKLYPVISEGSISNGSITEDKLSKGIADKLNSAATDANLKSLKDDVDTLKGDKTVTGSVDKKVSDAISSLVGSAPDTLNTLQKIAEEMQNPANNTAKTVLDEVANKANTTALNSEIERAKAAEQANTEKITQNTENIATLQNTMLQYEIVSQG